MPNTNPQLPDQVASADFVVETGKLEQQKSTTNHTLCVSCFNYRDENNQCSHCGWNPNSAPADAFYLIPGTILGDSYIVGKVLGHGGFGITYLGWDRELGGELALKLK